MADVGNLPWTDLNVRRRFACELGVCGGIGLVNDGWVDFWYICFVTTYVHSTAKSVCR
jgi:hypothetical protein